MARAFLAASLLVLATLTGCASAHRYAYTPEDLRRELARRVPEVPPEVLFEVSDADVARAFDLVKHLISSRERANTLVRSLQSPQGFGLRYDWAMGNDARSTLRDGGGTCLGLSSVLIGIARGIGLEAYYIDATVEPELREEEEVNVVAGHIAVLVQTDGGGLVVDYAGEVRRFRYFKRIDDLEAMARYHNNLGYEVIHRAQEAKQPVPWEAVGMHVERSTRIAPDFASGWNNLGVVRARLGDLAGAEQAYRKALELDPGFESASKNLARLANRRVGAPAAAGATAIPADPTSEP
jgi:tetratricopeptide (TPR) repeat protein